MTDPEDCVLCPLYRPNAFTAKGTQACDSCAVRLHSYLNAIRTQYALLDATPGGSRTEHVTGGERGIGVRIAVLDLITRSRTHAPAVRDLLGDQDGQVPVTTVLYLWITDWVDQRLRGESGPADDVDTQISWLVDRLDWALDRHAALADFCDEMRTLATVLRCATGDVMAKPEHKQGVPCKCDYMTLVRQPGEDLIDCTTCWRTYTPEEYEKWVRHLATEAQETANT